MFPTSGRPSTLGGSFRSMVIVSITISESPFAFSVAVAFTLMVKSSFDSP